MDETRAESTRTNFENAQAITYVRQRGMLALQPLCGGLPPTLAWESLRLVAEKVIPAVRG